LTLAGARSNREEQPMRRRTFLHGLGGLTAAALATDPGSIEAAATLPEDHFPDQLHRFVWRNWELANVERMADVIGCRPEEVLAIGAAMGLPPKLTLSGDQLRRLYITVIRQNWHLLPEDQLIGLLGWTRQRFHFTLKEDDFLDVKLGPKPDCRRLVYTPPGDAARRRAAEIKRLVRDRLGHELDAGGEPAFAFVSRLSAMTEENGGPFLTRGRVERQAAFDLRYLYSYFALYGDPLLEPDIDPFPDGLLEKLAGVGVNGVWLQAVLNTLAPSATFPEFGKDWETRLAALNRLVARASQFGIKVLLYLNEPRAMPPAFFRGREAMRGSERSGYHAMCTAHPAVRAWIEDSLAHVFRQVPELGGVFSITMSENLTNCYSKGKPETCPRCSQRPNWGEGVEEVLRAIHAGVRRSSPRAEVIVWDWGWREEQARYLIPRLPRDVKFQSVSEWSVPVERGGVKTAVGEYSISVVGPGPRARAHWALAAEAGVATLAKVQFNNTWEIGWCLALARSFCYLS
jgi:hypothetical protein